MSYESARKYQSAKEWLASSERAMMLNRDRLLNTERLLKSKEWLADYMSKPRPTAFDWSSKLEKRKPNAKPQPPVE